MKNNSSDNKPPAYNYVPPAYVPEKNSDQIVEEVTSKDDHQTQRHSSDSAEHWSSGICACFDDAPSCFVGLLCPCYLFAKNAEFLGSETFIVPCAIHFSLYYLLNMCCFSLSDGYILGLHGYLPGCLPGCLVACYAFGYRRTLGSKYNLPVAPCGDFITHFCCHLCAICQEYREIRERSGGSVSLDFTRTAAPPVQKMDTSETK